MACTSHKLATWLLPSAVLDHSVKQSGQARDDVDTVTHTGAP